MGQMRPFRFGVINDDRVEPEGWVEHVRRAEALGYDTFLIRDHLVPDFFGPQLAPLAAMATAAAVTERLRVGTLVLSNDFRHPALLAKEIATIDALSGGRVELGIGAGWLRSEYARAGIPYDPAGVRIDRLEESLRVLKGMLSGQPVTFEGEHYAINELDTYPRSSQRPRPPVLIGAGKPRMLRLAGREADIVSILTTSVASGTVEDDPAERLPATVREKLGWVREGAGERFDQIELSLIPSVIFTDDRYAAAERLIAERGWHDLDASAVLVMPSMLIGTADEIMEQLLERREEYGFTYYVVTDAIMDQFAPVVARLAGSTPWSATVTRR